MEIFIDILWLLAGLTALYFGAEWLVNGAAKIAVKYGISPLVVGLTIVAFGTSAPELFVSLGFNFGGEPDMAVGNVVGSNICNIALVLGASAFICALYIKSELLLRDLPIMIVASLIFVWMLMNGSTESAEGIFGAKGQISRPEGVFLFTAVVGYTFFQLALAKKIKNPEAIQEFEEEFGCKEGQCDDPVWKLAGMVLIGLVILYFGSKMLEEGGVGLAEALGVPGAVISLTLIAFSTSVPELATSVVAALKKEGDIITGNVIGSCIFNLLCVVGVTSIAKPITTVHIENIDLIVMVALAVITVPIMWTGRKIGRLEGAFLLACYIGYVIFLWFDRVAPAGAGAVS